MSDAPRSRSSSPAPRGRSASPSGKRKRSRSPGSGKVPRASGTKGKRRLAGNRRESFARAIYKDIQTYAGENKLQPVGRLAVEILNNIAVSAVRKIGRESFDLTDQSKTKTVDDRIVSVVLRRNGIPVKTGKSVFRTGTVRRVFKSGSGMRVSKSALQTVAKSVQSLIEEVFSEAWVSFVQPKIKRTSSVYPRLGSRMLAATLKGMGTCEKTKKLVLQDSANFSKKANKPLKNVRLPAYLIVEEHPFFLRSPHIGVARPDVVPSRIRKRAKRA